MPREDFSGFLMQIVETLPASSFFAIEYFNIRSKVGKFSYFSVLDPETLVSGDHFEFWRVSTYLIAINFGGFE